jgi:carbonic anhydrase
MSPLQSPIDIDRSHVIERDLPPIDVRYPTESVGVEVRFGVVDGDATPDGTNVVPQLIGTPAPSDAHVVVDGARFDLRSFHWHSPSEHLLDGHAFPLELHLVHASSEGGLLVLGVLFDAGPADASLAPAFDVIGGVGDSPQSVTMRLCDLAPSSPRTYRYDGSLTTAPFTEGVSWFVCTQARTASPEQLAAHEALVSAERPGFDGRPVRSARVAQNVAGRVVVTESV